MSISYVCRQASFAACAGLSSSGDMARSYARLSLTMANASPVSVRPFDASGRLGRTIQNGAWSESGRHDEKIDRQGLVPGVYLYRIETSGGSTSGRLVSMN